MIVAFFDRAQVVGFAAVVTFGRFEAGQRFRALAGPAAGVGFESRIGDEVAAGGG